MEIEVGEYVRTIDGKIGKFNRYSSRKENSLYKSPFNCFIDLKGRKTPLQCCENYIVKHSKNIIDLVEYNDIINGYFVVKYINDNGSVEDIENHEKRNEDIESILTHEQYENNCFRLEE